MIVPNTRRLKRFAVIYKGRSCGPTTSWPQTIWFDKEEEYDEAVRKLKTLVVDLNANAD